MDGAVSWIGAVLSFDDVQRAVSDGQRTLGFRFTLAQLLARVVSNVLAQAPGNKIRG